MTVETIIPTRGLIGFETDLLNLTRGTGVMSHLFKEYGPLELADALQFHLGGGRGGPWVAVWAPRRDRRMTEL